MGRSIDVYDNSNDQNKYYSLLDVYVDLIEKREEIIFKKQPYLESKYLFHFSDLMKEEIKRSINIKTLKRKIDLHSSNITRKESLELIEVDVIFEQIINLDEMVKLSKKYLEINNTTESEKEEIKFLFKELTKILHPDFCITITDSKRNLWDQVRGAYSTNNLARLRILSNLLSNKDNRNENKIKKYSVEEINEKINTIFMEINDFKKGFPFNIEKEIDNDIWIEEYKIQMRERIEKIKSDEIYLREKIKSLEAEDKMFL